MLETVGILSFNIAPADVPLLFDQIAVQYGLIVLQDTVTHPTYPGCTVADLIAQMSRQMSLGDAIQAVQIARHAFGATCLLTWNAKHFQGKLVIPVLTPEEWLNQRTQASP